MLDSDVTGGPPPRVDRRTRRRAATKAEILDAAWLLAREHGLAALSMRDLAGAVGMRAPSLYQYFDSKLAIYDAMFGQGMRQALDAVDGTGGSDGTGGADGIGGTGSRADGRQALHQFGRRLVAFTTVDPVRAQLLFQRTIPGFEPSSVSYEPALALSARAQRLLSDIDIDDPDAFDLWTALISGLTNQQLANDPDGDRWTRLTDRVVDLYLT